MHTKPRNTYKRILIFILTHSKLYKRIREGSSSLSLRKHFIIQCLIMLMKNNKIGVVLLFKDGLVGRGKNGWEAGGRMQSCSPTCSSGSGARGEKHRAHSAPLKAYSFTTCERE